MNNGLTDCQGTYGVVYMATDTETERVVALKQIRPDDKTSGVRCSVLRESALLKRMNHPNIVQLLDIVHYDDKPPCLVFEFLELDLGAYNSSRDLTDAVIRKFMKQLCAGIEHCHSRGVLHRDLKPQNLLIDTEDNLKICDFGLARSYDQPVLQYTSSVVSLWYRAPEILLGGLYGTGLDVWSAGCIFAEMCNKWPLFHSESETGLIAKIFKTLGTPDENTWPGITEYPHFDLSLTRWKREQNLCPSLDEYGLKLLDKMLTYDPRKRISARGALADPYLASNFEK